MCVQIVVQLGMLRKCEAAWDIKMCCCAMNKDGWFAHCVPVAAFYRTDPPVQAGCGWLPLVVPPRAVTLLKTNTSTVGAPQTKHTAMK